MALTDQVSTSKSTGEVLTKEDKSLVKVMNSLMKSCRRETEVLKASFIPAAASAICVSKEHNRSCCAWNEKKVMCCLMKDNKDSACKTWIREEDYLCYTKNGKLYCIE